MEEETIPNSAYHIDDERDYLYKDVFKEEMAGATLPNKFILDNVDYQNQGLNEDTKMGCVFYGAGHSSNEENFQEGSETRINNLEFCRLAVEKRLLSIKNGAMIRSGPHLLRIVGYSKGYTLPTTIEEVKHSIYNKRPVIVGSRSINWSSGYKAPYVLSGPKGAGHCVLIIGYNDTLHDGCFIIKQSYGNKRYDAGKQYLKYSDFGLLYAGKYSMIDTEDPIIDYKEKIRDNIDLESSKKAFDLLYWNGLEPRENISRQETVAIIMRALEDNKN